VARAHDQVFRVRVELEKSISKAVLTPIWKNGLNNTDFSKIPIHGCSKKQGVSIRMPLQSCVPTKLCGPACYAHDALDAAPGAVLRGALNGAIAALYEDGNLIQRFNLMKSLHKPVFRMITAALKDAKENSETYSRRPRIRFAHVGEFAQFPLFANALAETVNSISMGQVDSVVYTRHPNANLLDKKFFIVLFSLDKSSEDRRKFIPEGARVVRSAFDGNIVENVDVNFLEHHRWIHISPIGSGKICPATEAATKVKTCDACKCDLCFTRKSDFSL
jgi:hypothetical protein